MRWKVGLFGVLPSVLGCGPGGLGGDSGLPVASCDTVQATSDAAVSGRLYFDQDSADRSVYAAGYDSESDTPIGARSLRLLGQESDQTEESCADGSYAFNDLEDGVYVLRPDAVDADCLQKNCPTRFPEAIAEGKVKIVTMGDSVPVVGDSSVFPKRVKTLFSSLATIKNKNVAVSGSLSTQWLPGTNYFENRLAPELEDADVVVMSIGGNDILNSLGLDALADPEATVEKVRTLIQEISDNVLETSDAIQEINPDLDVLYCLYVNYGSANISPWNIVNAVAPEGAMEELMSGARDTIGSDENIILVDLFGASLELDNLDAYLYDALHFNDKGHTFYAEEVFKALGGVLIGESPLEGEPRSPIGTHKNWSFSQ